MEKRQEEQREFGVFFDDDYNYLQHLRETARPVEWASSSKSQRGKRTHDLQDGDDDDEDEEEEKVTPVSLTGGPVVVAEWNGCVNVWAIYWTKLLMV